MPSKSPAINQESQTSLIKLGAAIRTYRTAKRISAVIAAHSANISRITLHRIEHGEPSVAMGSYMSVLNALGMRIDAIDSHQNEKEFQTHESDATMASSNGLPDSIDISHYPQLRQIAWHIRDGFKLTHEEAFNLYERYSYRLDMDRMSTNERDLYQKLMRQTAQ